MGGWNVNWLGGEVNCAQLICIGMGKARSRFAYFSLYWVDGII